MLEQLQFLILGVVNKCHKHSLLWKLDNFIIKSDKMRAIDRNHSSSDLLCDALEVQNWIWR